MSDHSAIQWTDATWNPTTGCTKVSPACAHCYIERTPPFRMKGRTFVKGHIPLELHENRLAQPLSWKKPRRVFVNSLSDLFHDEVPDLFIDRAFASMALSGRHSFQLLTKRPVRMLAYITRLEKSILPLQDAAVRMGYSFSWQGLSLQPWPIPNIWLGVSVENQHFADQRIPLLLQTPAAVRFISAEPLLGPLTILREWRGLGHRHAGQADDPSVCCCGRHRSLHGGIDWVIAGGESGPRLRPSNPDWFRSLRDQCVAAGVPFFFKQWGGPTPKSGGRELDGREWNEFPRHQS